MFNIALFSGYATENYFKSGFDWSETMPLELAFWYLLISELCSVLWLLSWSGGICLTCRVCGNWYMVCIWIWYFWLWHTYDLFIVSMLLDFPKKPLTTSISWCQIAGWIRDNLKEVRTKRTLFRNYSAPEKQSNWGDYRWRSTFTVSFKCCFQTLSPFSHFHTHI